jgi:radical SAM superfamily enzyme YgiQ (UPF0313 family)
MKCVLVIPAWRPEDIFSSKTAGSQINYWQPLGTLYVAACLQRAGHEVKFLNGAFMSHDEIIAEVKGYSPEFVGIYSTTFGWPRAKRTARDIKDVLKETFICVGGPYPIAMQERCLEDEDAEAIDAVVTGEGELTVPEMLQMLQSDRSLRGVKGVVFREKDRIIKNPPRPLIEDLDSIPFPARELLGDPNKYIPPPATYRRKPVATMITSRGCKRRCIFCFQIDPERKSGIRYRSVDNVLAEIETLLRQGYKEIKFLDDTFAADYNRAMEIAEEIKRRRLKFTWFVSACVDQVDKPLLQAFKDAGCWAILFGAESGVQKNLNTIKKGITLEQTRRAVKAAKEVGLKVSTPFIFGIPGETFEEGLKTIEFALELDPDIANFHAITPFPGTYLYNNLEKYGTISEDLSDFTYQGAAFIPYTMTRDEILKLRQIAFRKFYSRPRYLLRRLLNIRNIHDIKAALKGFKSLFWLWAKKDIFKKA